MITTTRAAQIIGVSTRTLMRWRQKSIGPPYVHIPAGGRGGNGIYRYRPEDVEAWLRGNSESKAVSPATDADDTA